MTIQSSVSAPSAATVGQPYDGEGDVLSGYLATRKLVSVAITASNSQVYTITINSVACSYTADGSASTAEIALGLVAAINGSTQAGNVTASGTDTPILIESDVDSDFTYSDSAGTGALVETVLVAHNQSAPAGVFVCVDERAARGSLDFAVRLPRASADITGSKRFGITTKTRGSESASYSGQCMVNCLVDGRIWVTTEEAVTAGDPVYVRYAAGVGGTQLGAIRKSDPGSEAALLANAKFMTDGSAAGLAVVQVDIA